MTDDTVNGKEHGAEDGAAAESSQPDPASDKQPGANGAEFPYVRNMVPAIGGMEFIYTDPKGGRLIGSVVFKSGSPEPLVAMAEDFMQFARDAVRAAEEAKRNRPAPPAIARATADALAGLRRRKQ